MIKKEKVNAVICAFYKQFLENNGRSLSLQSPYFQSKNLLTGKISFGKKSQKISQFKT